MSFVKVKRQDGVIIEVPEEHLPLALRISKGRVVSDEEVLQSSAIQPPKQKEDFLICPICGFKAKTKTGLLAHKRLTHKIR